jgi:hypothetical protein
MLLIDDGAGGVIGVRAGLRDYLRIHLTADRIDRDLAEGASPDATVASALRAQELTSMQSRRDLASGLQRALAAAIASGYARLAGAPLARDGVLAAAAEIGELSRRLLADGPVSVRGVAETRLLLTNGAGPLHNRRSQERLAATVRRAIRDLDINGSGSAA